MGRSHTVFEGCKDLWTLVRPESRVDHSHEAPYFTQDLDHLGRQLASLTLAEQTSDPSKMVLRGQFTSWLVSLG